MSLRGGKYMYVYSLVGGCSLSHWRTEPKDGAYGRRDCVHSSDKVQGGEMLPNLIAV